MEKKIENEVPNVKREGWSAEKIAEEASSKEADEVYRQILRGDETDGGADDRDIAGSSDRNETPQGREETKNNQQEQN